jgi:hypothetical protein
LSGYIKCHAFTIKTNELKALGCHLWQQVFFVFECSWDFKTSSI